MLRRFVSCLAVTCVAASARSVHAQVQTLGPELVTNGDFATGLGGWTRGGIGTAPCAPGSLSGIGAACLVTYYQGAGPSLTVLPAARQQNVATTVGERYQLSFFAQARPFYYGPSVFGVYWGSTLVTTLTSGANGGGGFPGTTFSFFVDAAAASTTLRFENVLQDYCRGIPDPFQLCGEDAGNIVTLDNVSVRAATVPEPSVWALLGAGLAPLAVAARRRRRG